jgi:hypothetical protein
LGYPPLPSLASVIEVDREAYDAPGADPARRPVVALIRGEETTLKRIIQEPGRVTLTPENRALEPITLAPEDVEIQGVLVGQMRAYR